MPVGMEESSFAPGPRFRAQGFWEVGFIYLGGRLYGVTGGYIALHIGIREKKMEAIIQGLCRDKGI